MKKNISLFVRLALVVSIIVGCTNNGTSTIKATETTEPAKTEAPVMTESNIIETKTNNWSIKVNSFSFNNSLKTETVKTLYNGDKDKFTYENSPADGKKYLIANISVNKTDNVQEDMKLNNIYIDVNGTKINRIENDTFLEDHDYSPLQHNNIAFGQYKGDIIFEVDKEIDSANIKIAYNSDKTNILFPITEITKVEGKTDKISDTNIPFSLSLVEDQNKVEKEIETEFKSNEYTFENPLIIQDPYGLAKLTALVMFKTEEETQISINVKGKNEYTDVEKTFDEFTKVHQIPVLGLYADYDNTVTITSTKKDGTTQTKVLNIKTDKLQSNAPHLKLNKSNPESMEEGFTFLPLSFQYLVVDSNADVRWYQNYESYYIFTRLKNGNMLIFDDSPYLKYDGRMRLVEMDMLGRVYNTYYVKGGANHEAMELENGNILVACNDDSEYQEDHFVELDRKTGETVKSVSMRDILPKEMWENTTYADKDWFHLNAIWQDGDDLILSGARQDITIKISYPECEIKWILTYPDKVPESIQKYLLKPVDGEFKYPNMQHSVSIIPDTDNNPETKDLMLFDNNYVYTRGDKEQHAKYSHAIKYAINEKEMTIKQDWQFGKELGKEYFSSTQSDAKYYPKSGNVLSIFSNRDMKTYGVKSSVIETDFNTPANIVFDMDITPEGSSVFTYRASRYNIYPETWNVDIGSLNATAHGEDDANYDDVDSFTKMDIDLNSLEKNKVSVDEIKLNSNNILNIEGYAFQNKVSTSNTENYLVFNSEKNVQTLPLRKVNRWDLINTFPEDGIMYTSGGFNTNVDVSKFVPSEYKVGILTINNDTKVQTYTDTNYKFTIADNSRTSIKNQKVIKDSIKAQFESGKYDEKKPLIVVDPFDLSPLSAIMMFNTKQDSKVSVTIAGKDKKSTFTYDFTENSKIHQLPIYGLYGGGNNYVTINVKYKDGTSKKYTHTITTKETPTTGLTAKVSRLDETNAIGGLTFLGGRRFTGVDLNGDTRFYFSNDLIPAMTTSTVLKNGNIAIDTEIIAQAPYHMDGVYEMNYLGEIIRKYDVPGGAHHDIDELPNGNLLINSNNVNRDTHEDFIVEVDRITGNIIKSWDLYEILDVEKTADINYRVSENIRGTRNNPDFTTEEEIKAEADRLSEDDWFHNNAVFYDDGNMIVSGRNQDMVVKFNMETNEIIWILTDANDVFSEETRKKILKPIGKDFEQQYGQHDPIVLPNGDLFLYDNGNFRSKTVEGALDPKNNYSRGVIYRIDEEKMTVSQVWQYGKELGNDTFTPYIGSVQYLGENHYLIGFGGIIKNDKGVNSMYLSDALTGKGKTSAKTVEIKDDKVVSIVDSTGEGNANTYRAMRGSIYENAKELNFLK